MSNPIRQLSVAEAAYIAGVVDGEGTISLVRHHCGENRRPVVSVANTELMLLDYLKTTIGAGRITRKRIAQSHHTPSFTFVIFSRQALALLEQIAPYMHTCKRGRAELLQQEYLAVTARSGRYTAEMLAAREAFEERFFAIRVRAEPKRGLRGFGVDGYSASISGYT
jgi:hypothetical protein